MTKAFNDDISDRNGGVLTAYFGGGTEHISHLLVHGDHDVLLGGHVPVAQFDLRLHPVGEVLLENGGADIADPLFADLVDLLIVRHEVEDMPMAVAEEESDVLQGETLVLGHLDVPDLGAADACSRE